MKKKEKKQESAFTNGLSETTTSSTLTTAELNALLTLEKHKHIYDLYNTTQEVINFHLDIREEVVNAYKVFYPHYHYNRSCTVCITEMLNIVYNFYNKKINER